MDQNQPTFGINNGINNTPPVTPKSPTSGMVEMNKPKKVGPIIVTLIIILILIIGILYVFASRINQPPTPNDNSSIASEPVTTDNRIVETVQPVTGTADDPSSLQNDLNSSINGLDSQNF